MYSTRPHIKKCLALVLLGIFPSFCRLADAVQTVNRSTLDGKVLVGYQGWFRCPTDPSDWGRWLHWTTSGVPTAASVQFDAFPDLSELSAADLYSVPTLTIQGKPVNLYSGWSSSVVTAHFLWMRQYGIDGALLQRFVIDIPGEMLGHEQVIKNVMAAAKAQGRTWAIEYDVTGADMATVAQVIDADWQYLNRTLGVAASAAYLHDNGKPVVGVWGLGFPDKRHLSDPVLGSELIRLLQTTEDVTLIGGVPAGWRTLSKDSSTDPRWTAAYAMLDVIEPWTVGRYYDVNQANYWQIYMTAPDLKQTQKHNQGYMPVIFPGFSWHNLNRGEALNQIPRAGGAFLWRQAYQDRASGVSFIKIAMFDEVNEGTAIFKVVSKRSQAPDQGDWLTLDADGFDLPSDWYLRLTYEFAKAFHTDTQVPEDLPANPGP
jgi:hypothetical protein